MRQTLQCRILALEILKLNDRLSKLALFHETAGTRKVGGSCSA
jgi:hypothetical protein